jgi:DNA-binding CsgD family transcriptional regulator
MGRRRDRWAPPPRGGKPPTEPMLQIELYPNPEPPPGPPVTRESVLASLQSGLSALTDDELRVARLWLLGHGFLDVCELLRMEPKLARGHWRAMRRKLRDALKAGG